MKYIFKSYLCGVIDSNTLFYICGQRETESTFKFELLIMPLYLVSLAKELVMKVLSMLSV